MVDIRATGAEEKARDEAAAQRRARFQQAERDMLLVDAAAEELKQRHENLWVAAYNGEVYSAATLRDVLKHFNAIGRPEVGVQIVFVAADGQTRIIR